MSEAVADTFVGSANKTSSRVFADSFAGAASPELSFFVALVGKVSAVLCPVVVGSLFFFVADLSRVFVSEASGFWAITPPPAGTIMVAAISTTKILLTVFIATSKDSKKYERFGPH